MKMAFEPFSSSEVKITDAELLRRRKENYDYMMSLKTDNLLQNFDHEAGLDLMFNNDYIADRHGGWENPFCEMRGHFLGHWLSAAGMHIAATGDQEIKAKADKVIARLAECQEANGGEWVAGIPEKYLYWIAEGRRVWSPQYNVHKILMGLMDYYEYTGNELSLEIADNFSMWFYKWSMQFDREKFDDILDVETGGMLEVWAQLYAVTKKAEHRALMDKYYRGRLFDALLRGEDVLTNMHANTTVPEVLGAAKAYEVTGEQKWLDIVKAYWDFAVTRRGTYATGGQTCGEIWTPMHDMNLRLGEKNQEHCVVYNMMRMAEFLFRWTGEAVYADYWEKNMYNGVMAQTYWDGRADHTNAKKYDYPRKGLLTYFLPMKGGSQKFWASETEDFFCCHGTLVQANAAFTDGIYYQTDDSVVVCQYFDSSVTGEVGGTSYTVEQRGDSLSGTNLDSSELLGAQTIRADTRIYDHDPNKVAVRLNVKAEKPAVFTLKLRIPSWIMAAPYLCVNGAEVPVGDNGSGFIELTREWSDDTVYVEFQKGIRVCPLPGDESKVAFLNGPVVLAGLCDEERVLYAEKDQPVESLLEPFNEREWGNWKQTFQTVGQDRTIEFFPVTRIGYDRYTIYFPIKRR